MPSKSAAGDFRLTPASPCVGAGVAAPDGPAADFDGIYWQSPPAIGPFELLE